MTEQAESPFQAKSGEASWTVLANVLNVIFKPDPLLGRQNVMNWARRGTRNKQGLEFPAPVRTNPQAEGHKGQPGAFYSINEVVEWYRDGPPSDEPLAE